MKFGDSSYQSQLELSKTVNFFDGAKALLVANERVLTLEAEIKALVDGAGKDREMRHENKGITNAELHAILEKEKKSTRVNAWYPHPGEGEGWQVRGPFCRWFKCTEVEERYKKNTADTEDDVIFAASAMNFIGIVCSELLRARDENLRLREELKLSEARRAELYNALNFISIPPLTWEVYKLANFAEKTLASQSRPKILDVLEAALKRPHERYCAIYTREHKCDCDLNKALAAMEKE